MKRFNMKCQYFEYGDKSACTDCTDCTNNPAYKNNQSCKEHTCQIPICKSIIRSSWANEPIARYCDDHTCIYNYKERCHNPAIIGSLQYYCSDHTCSVDRCLEVVTGIHGVCLEHSPKCVVCNKPVSARDRVEELGDSLHWKCACTVFDCKNPVISIECEYCVEHQMVD